VTKIAGWVLDTPVIRAFLTGDDSAHSALEHATGNNEPLMLPAMAGLHALQGLDLNAHAVQDRVYVLGRVTRFDPLNSTRMLELHLVLERASQPSELSGDDTLYATAHVVAVARESGYLALSTSIAHLHAIDDRLEARVLRRPGPRRPF
jgi:hypothetical protein